ncbi:MAG: MipA/OmpV family protein [Firmicutes bacterium]|nr:MipA/OmpV family protein [Bacillota bacterium]
MTSLLGSYCTERNTTTTPKPPIKVKRPTLCLYLAAPSIIFSVFSTSAVQATEEQEMVMGPPQGASIGAAYVSSNQSYRGLNADSVAVPFLGFEGQQFYIRGLTAGWYLQRDRQQQLAVTLNGELFRFRPTESTDSQMQQLDRRNLSLTLGLQHRYSSRFGVFSSHLKTDITGRHEGQLFNFRYGYPLNRPGQAWQVTPEVGFNYYSRSYIDYYYGVSAAEAQRSGFIAYKPSDAINPLVGVNVYRYFTPQLSAITSYTIARNDTSIRNSPMVQGRSTRSLFLAVSYRF